MDRITLNTVPILGGKPKTIGRGDPCWCKLDKCRVRIHRVVDSTSVEVTDNDGKVLPDYRHPTQLLAY